MNKVQWRLDFIAAENSMGFHAPQEAARLLGEALDYARQDEVAAVTAGGDGRRWLRRATGHFGVVSRGLSVGASIGHPSDERLASVEPELGAVGRRAVCVFSQAVRGPEPPRRGTTAPESGRRLATRPADGAGVCSRTARATRHAEPARRGSSTRGSPLASIGRDAGVAGSAPPYLATRSKRMIARHVKHPILRLVVLASDGTRATECSVFCRLKHQSVRLEECCSCVHCDAITDGSRGAVPSVECTIPETPLLPSDDPRGDFTEVGTLLCTGTIVVAEAATLRAALDVLRAEDRREVAIVDDRHVLIGLVHETAFIARRASGFQAVVGSTMSTAIAVHERTPVRAALRLLAASHLREATVVSAEGRPIGVFRDVDGLRWIAAAATAHRETVPAQS